MGRLSLNTMVLLGAVAGLVSGSGAPQPVLDTAAVVSDLFIRLLRLVSAPIIFLALVSTLTGMKDSTHARKLASMVLKYSLLTTLFAATIALAVFLVVDPVRSVAGIIGTTEGTVSGGYGQYLLSLVPSSFVAPFIDNQIVSVLLLALLLSISILSLPDHQRNILHELFDSLFSAIMRMTGLILFLLPLAIWAFVTDFCKTLEDQQMLAAISLYVACILAANLIQAIVVLPGMLLLNGLPPWKIFKGILPTLMVAFFAKSSSAALPSAMENAEKKLGISSEITRFSFPLCITINMNACAAFILITVLFVSMIYGVTYSGLELAGWIFIASLAAFGNAGVPMGCYLLSSTILASMNIPLHVMGVILPVYALIDMLESAINVWSDTCVTSVINKKASESDHAAASIYTCNSNTSATRVDQGTAD